MASTEQTENANADFGLPAIFSEILKPGSSRNPVFLMILDGVLALLLLVLLSLLFMTSGNVHIIALIVIECCLWASIKWFLHELSRVQIQEAAAGANGETKKDQ